MRNSTPTRVSELPAADAAAIPALSSIRKSDSPARASLMEAVETYFRRYGLPARGARILVAISGGPDSTALLAAMAIVAEARQWVIEAAHVNYRWRGEDSERDEALCHSLANRWGLKLHVERPVPAADATVNRQAWARQVRYGFFDHIRLSGEFDCIALGHQLDDRAESVAAAILEAGGTFALSGIPPTRDTIIRPLFSCDRRIIVAFLDSLGVPYRTDHSNSDPRYQRNRIRMSVLPQWSAENPSIASGLARIGEQLWRQNEYLLSEAVRLLALSTLQVRPGRIVLDAESLITYDRALDPFVLRAILRQLGAAVVPTPASVDRFSELRLGGSGGRVEQGDFMIERSKGRLVAKYGPSAMEPPAAQILSRHGQVQYEEWTLTASTVPAPANPSTDDEHSVLLNEDAISGDLLIRATEAGDRYQPFRFRGHKKLADLFADAGVPAALRRHIPIVTDASGILWPVGFPVADRARLEPATRHALQITVTRP